MKVCLLNDSFPPVIDGVANVVMNYANIMQTQNLADVLVATPRYPGAEYNIYPYWVVPYHSFDTTSIVKGYRAGNPLDIKELKIMSDFEPDIIHSHCPITSTYLARMVRSAAVAPLIFTYHTKFDEDIARAVKDEFIQKETIKAIVQNISACDEVWVVSNGAGENLKSLGYQGDYRVVNNGVDFAKGKVDASTVKKVCEGYDLPENVPVFLFVGRIISYKGIPIILDALKILSDKGMDFRMVFIGSGPDLDFMKDKARQLGLYENEGTDTIGKCYFTGPIYDRDKLRAWNTRADLFLFPSTYDTNGIVVREAAACGLASLLIKGSCAAEGITDGRNGFLAEQNPESISKLLLKVGKDISHMKEIGQNAMDEIYISWEESVHEAHNRYKEILELKKNGEFPIKSKTTLDKISHIPDDIFDEIKKYYDSSSRKFENMLDNVGELTDEVVEKIGSLMGRFK